MTMTLTETTMNLPIIGLGPQYASRHIWLPQLAAEFARRGETVIKDRTFTDCFIEGPSVLLPVGECSFDGCDMGDAMGDIRNLMLAPVGPQKVTGVVAFQNCTFVKCRFLRIGFTGTPEFLENLARTLKGVRT